MPLGPYEPGTVSVTRVLDLDPIDVERVAAELARMLPEVERTLKALENAKRVPPEVFNMVIVI